MTDEELTRILENTVHVTTSYRLFDANAIRKLVNELRQVTRERDWLAETCASVLYKITNKLISKGLELSYPPTKEEILIEAKEATFKQYSALEPCSFTASNNSTPPNNRKPRRKLVRKKLCQIK